ncbi:ribose-phosphate diphosphokinase [Paenibacillus tarimensis]
MKNKNIAIFSGSSNPRLAQSICRQLEHPLGKIRRLRFSSGEIYIRYEEGLRNRDVYLIQTFSHPVNEHFVELLVMIDAAKRASAKTVTIVVPYFGYARQERTSAPREPISAKLVADMLETAGADRLITLDLHAAAIQGFFNIPVDHLTALDMICDVIKSLKVKHPIIVSPDAGRMKTAEKAADYLNYPCAIMIKKRPSFNNALITHVVGEVTGRTPIIIEDMIDTGSTIVNVVEGLKERGADDAYVCATHPVFSGAALTRLHHPMIKEIIVTDSIPLPEQYPGFLRVISVSVLLAKAIRIHYSGGSISNLFKSSRE